MNGMNKPLQVAKYVTADLITAGLAWGLFFIYRKEVAEPGFCKPVSRCHQRFEFLPGTRDHPFLLAFPVYHDGDIQKNFQEITFKKNLDQTLTISFVAYS